MTKDTPDSLRWPGANDRAVVEEMLRNKNSESWTKCREFISERVQKQAKNIPKDAREDIVQETVTRVSISLPYFQYKSRFKTWLISITTNCIIDEVRRREREVKHIAPSEDSRNTPSDEEPLDTHILPASNSTEDMCITREKLQEALKALLEHLATRHHSDRDRLIVDRVLFKGYSLEDAAQEAGCSAATAGYVVRTAQEHVRKVLGHDYPPKNPPEV